jgi:hypothetical protein
LGVVWVNVAVLVTLAIVSTRTPIETVAVLAWPQDAPPLEPATLVLRVDRLSVADPWLSSPPPCSALFRSTVT